MYKGIIMGAKEIIIKSPGKTIITCDNDKVVITRKGVINFVNQGIKGEKTIPLKSITSIQLKKPGMTNGYIQFGILGGIESKSGVFNATKDENSVADELLKLKQLLDLGVITDDEFEQQKSKLLVD